MGCMFRSDPMTFCDIYVQVEAAFETMSELGEMGCVQFLDMNPDVSAFSRKYLSEVCRCAEMERKLRFLEAELIKYNIYIPYTDISPKAVHPNEMHIYENIFDKWQNDISEMTDNNVTIMKAYVELTEFDYVLTHIGPMLGDTDIQREHILKNLGPDIEAESRLYITTGIIKRARSYSFQMMLWRVCRGNIYYKQASEDLVVIDPYTNKEVRRVAFLVVCQGEQLFSRIQKIFAGFRVSKYDLPKTEPDREKLHLDIRQSIADMDEVIKKTKYLRCKALCAVGKQWKMWMTQIRKAKAIYHTMGLFSLDITKNCLIGQCWVPSQDLLKVQDTLDNCSDLIGTAVPSFLSKTTTNDPPPTFHRTNKFTNGFQALINAYGDSQYGELNPGLCTIITFPFLFALMFADLGHACIIVSFGLWMVLNEKEFMTQQSTNEIWNIFFGGRYIILLLGLFSVYTGFIYNDCFSKAFCLSTSFWVNTMSTDYIKFAFLELDPKFSLWNKPYVFGIDPVWSISANKIMVENSLKMKLSIIFGVIHMTLGLIMSLVNHIHFKKYYAIFLEFIPEIVFLTCIFLWLVIMIYMKWFMYGAHNPHILRNAGCAPQILILFIDMVLLSESKSKEPECAAYMFRGQMLAQRILLFIAVACVPILLFGSPLFIYCSKKKSRPATQKNETKKSQFRAYRYSDEEIEPGKEEEKAKPHSEEHSEDFSDLMIHQGVHTIEFVLSTISHTASYLRLWALSLAHAQLSEMLWSMILAKLALKDRSIGLGVPKLFVIFSIWAAFTLSILVLMEGLSAFLHTLRLHWVEYMSKFYMGGGQKFLPYSFRVILSTDSDKTEAGCKIKDDKRGKKNLM